VGILPEDEDSDLLKFRTQRVLFVGNKWDKVVPDQTRSATFRRNYKKITSDFVKTPSSSTKSGAFPFGP
jgi:hypothetical protein